MKPPTLGSYYLICVSDGTQGKYLCTRSIEDAVYEFTCSRKGCLEVDRNGKVSLATSSKSDYTANHVTRKEIGDLLGMWEVD